ncbi:MULTISPECIES: hypothetical protein [Bacillus]|uniref:hypothetical protein n=1 Tax=Bacillus TaxID=1386 RepID=UPI0012FF3A6A|nr:MULTISPECIES: hypothetical protein [Bacillus]
MMDYQYRRKALQSFKEEKEEVKLEIKKQYEKNGSIIATLLAFLPFFNHSS